MEINFIKRCLDLCGLQVEEQYLIKSKNRVIEILKDFNESEDVRFDIYHNFYGGDIDMIKLEISNLSLFETIEKLNTLNQNISSYEFYYALPKD